VSASTLRENMRILNMQPRLPVFPAIVGLADIDLELRDHLHDRLPTGKYQSTVMRWVVVWTP
jgi:hypothetical protein